MKKWILYLRCICSISIFLLLISGCSAKRGLQTNKPSTENNKTGIPPVTDVTNTPVAEKITIKPPATQTPEPKIILTDMSGYFNGLNGSAVIYNASSRQYTIYNKKLALKRKSPCSTFKIISSLIGTMLSSVIIISLLYPIVFKFGATNGRIILFAVVFGAAGIGALIAQFVDMTSIINIINRLDNYSLIAIPIISVILLGISYLISNKIYQRKEF